MTVVTYRQNITGMMDCLIQNEWVDYFELTVLDSVAQSIERFIESQSLQNDERPNKRRKLDRDTTDDPNGVEDTSARNKNVVLCRITIDLVSCFIASCRTSTHHSDADS